MQDGKMDGFSKNLNFFLQDYSTVSIKYRKTMCFIQIRPFKFVKWSKFFKSDKNAGWNKSAGRNFFQKLIKVQDVIRLCRLEFSEKLISCAACLLDTLEYYPT